MAKLQMGLVGGGEGSFIGAIHRMAAELDGLDIRGTIESLDLPRARP